MLGNRRLQFAHLLAQLATESTDSVIVDSVDSGEGCLQRRFAGSCAIRMRSMNHD